MVTGTFIFLMIVVMVICVMLVLVVLSQNPKGGGLSSTFGGGGGGQMFGVQRTNDFLDKATWTLAILIAVVVILANVMLPRSNSQDILPDVPLQEQTLPTTGDTETSDAATTETSAPATETPTK